MLGIGQIVAHEREGEPLRRHDRRPRIEGEFADDVSVLEATRSEAVAERSLAVLTQPQVAPRQTHERLARERHGQRKANVPACSLRFFECLD